MRLCDREEIAQLIEAGELTVDPGNDHEQVTFLDEHRVGLHLDRLFKVAGEVDLASPQAVEAVAMPIAGSCLQPWELYLGVTREALSLGNRLAASLYTRSRYARLGLEMLGSSRFVVPGFGSVGAAPLVLEMSVRQVTKGLDPAEVYCFLLLYHLDRPRRTPNLADYRIRFPLRYGHSGGTLEL